jgi:hypothetical protein
VLFLGDVLAGPGCFNRREERHYVGRPFAHGGVVDDVVVVVVEDQGDVEFLTDGEEVVDGPDLKTAHPQIRHGSGILYQT